MDEDEYAFHAKPLYVLGNDNLNADYYHHEQETESKILEKIKQKVKVIN